MGWIDGKVGLSTLRGVLKPTWLQNLVNHTWPQCVLEIAWFGAAAGCRSSDSRSVRLQGVGIRSRPQPHDFEQTLKPSGIQPNVS